MLPVVGLAASIGILMLYGREHRISWSDLLGKMIGWGAIPTLTSHLLLGLFVRQTENRREVVSNSLVKGLKSAFRGSLYVGLLYPAISISGIANFSKKEKGVFGGLIGLSIGILYGSLRGNAYMLAYNSVRIPLMASIAALHCDESQSSFWYSTIGLSLVLSLSRFIESNTINFLSPKSKYKSPIPYFKKRFGTERKMCALPTQTEVLVTSTNVRTSIQHKFTRSNRPDLEVFRAAAATSAAPSFFPQVLIDNDHYVDGGIGVNNPTAAAWNFFKKEHPDATPANTVILSLGTGEVPIEDKSYTEITQKTFLDVILPAIKNILIGTKNTDQEMQQQFSEQKHYFRIQATLDKEISLDATTPENMSALKIKAQETIDIKREKIDEFCALASSTLFGAGQLRRPPNSYANDEDEEKNSAESESESELVRRHGFDLS